MFCQVITATTTTIILLLLVSYTAHPARGAYFGSQNNSPLYCGRVQEGLMVVEYDDGLQGKWHCCLGIRRSSGAQRLLCDRILLVAIAVECDIGILYVASMLRFRAVNALLFFEE